MIAQPSEDLVLLGRIPLPPVPDSVHQIRIAKREGGEGTRLWVDDLDGLLGLVEIGAVELHPWQATLDDIEYPDLIVFELDPGENVGWDFVVETALAMRDRLGPALKLFRFCPSSACFGFQASNFVLD